MTGGTPHGWLTVHRTAVPPESVPGLHEPDARRVSAAGPALRGGVPRPDGGVADGWEAADRAPVDRLPQLSPADTGRAPLVYPGLPETVCAPGRAGALVREGAAHSQALETPPLAGPAGRTPCPRGCPSPLADRLGPAARRRGGGRRHPGRPAGGGRRACGRRSRRRASGPPVAHDGTARRLVRPQDPLAQHESYRGKNRDHTGNNVLRVNALRRRRLLSDTSGGRTHDKPLAAATPAPVPAGSRLLPALGCLAFTLPAVASLMPTKTPRGQELALEEQVANQALPQRRLRIEPVNSSVKRWRIVKDRMRLGQDGIRARVMESCCALQHFRVRLTPWQPMV